MDEDQFQIIVNQKDFDKLTQQKNLYKDSFEKVTEKLKNIEKLRKTETNTLIQSIKSLNNIIKKFISEVFANSSKQHLKKQSSYRSTDQIILSQSFDQLMQQNCQIRKQIKNNCELTASNLNIIKEIVIQQNLSLKKFNVDIQILNQKNNSLSQEKTILKSQKQNLQKKYASLSSDHLQALELSEQLNSQNSILKQQLTKVKIVVQNTQQEAEKSSQSYKKIMIECEKLKKQFQQKIQLNRQSLIKFEAQQEDKLSLIKQNINNYYAELFHDLSKVENLSQNQLINLVNSELGQIINYTTQIIKSNKTKSTKMIMS